jgi:uncharacterized membrane protein
MSRPASRLLNAMIVLLCVVSPWLAHFAVSAEDAGVARLALLCFPLLVLAYWALVHARSKPLGLTLLLVAGAATYALEHEGSLGLAAAYGLPHAAIYLFLLWLFGRTLLPGREPLVTGLARSVRGALPPHQEVYTRGVTVAWCVFFAAQVAVSALLFLLAPLDAWSLFINVLNLPLLVLMFAAEYLYRTVRHPGDDRTTIVGALQAFLKHASVTPGAKVR